MKHQIDPDEYIKTNRENAKATKLGYDWCGGCDKALVADGKKCPVCGRKKYKKRIRGY